MAILKKTHLTADSGYGYHLSRCYMRCTLGTRPVPIKSRPTTRRKRIFHGYDCLLDCPGMGFPSLPDPQTMLSERRDGTLLVRAPAKVNLFLEVLAKRPDGYHE